MDGGSYDTVCDTFAGAAARYCGAVFGALADAVILPAATEFLVRMLPPAVREETERRVTRYGTIVFIASIVVLVLWIAILVWALSKVFS